MTICILSWRPRRGRCWGLRPRSYDKSGLRPASYFFVQSAETVPNVTGLCRIYNINTRLLCARSVKLANLPPPQWRELPRVYRGSCLSYRTSTDCAPSKTIPPEFSGSCSASCSPSGGVTHGAICIAGTSTPWSVERSASTPKWICVFWFSTGAFTCSVPELSSIMSANRCTKAGGAFFSSGWPLPDFRSVDPHCCQFFQSNDSYLPQTISCSETLFIRRLTPIFLCS